MISRRTFLRGAGALVALPLLEQMLPSIARAGSPSPTRLVIFNSPTGMAPGQFTPMGEGAGFTLSPILAPLANLKSDILVISGLSNGAAKFPQKGAGHARGAGTFLTCTPIPASVSILRNGVSVDQVVAHSIVGSTHLRSLELGTTYGSNAGSCDFGFNCAYQNAICWGPGSEPLPREVNPQRVFDRLFGSPLDRANPKDADVRRARRQSILDAVKDDAASLRQKLGSADQAKVDEYLGSVREMELRISAATTPLACGDTGPRPAGVPDDHRAHVKLMLDLLVLALQCDATRVVTFQYEHTVSLRQYPFLSTADGQPITNGWHDITHHMGDATKLEKYRVINTWIVSQLAYLLGKLKAVNEAGGTLLDNSLVYFGSELSDGNQHNFDGLPVLLAGNAQKRIQTGRHLKVPDATPLSNLYLAMLQTLGVHASSFGDSTGALSLSA